MKKRIVINSTSDEALVKRLLPKLNADPRDRALAWWEWYVRVGEAAVLAFIRIKNDTPESDMDIFQDAMMTAFMEVERGRYKPRAGIPLTAYVKGIAYNKIREAYRRARRSTLVKDALQDLSEGNQAHLETVVELREQQNALRVGLATLSPGRRQVLEGYLNGHNTAEIAHRLGMSAELVRKHKSRGLRTLRALDIFAIMRR